jgi:hypothetical protein
MNDKEILENLEEKPNKKKQVKRRNKKKTKGKPDRKIIFYKFL